MKIKPTRLAIVLCLSFVMTSCAGARPEVAPEIDRAQVPTLKIPRLKSRSVDLSVENQRSVNQNAGNSAQIESLIKDVLTESLSRSQTKITSKSSNKLAVVITDCEGRAADSFCVTFKTKLSTPGETMTLSASGGSGYHLEGSDVEHGGNLNEAYQQAISSTIEMLNKESL